MARRPAPLHPLRRSPPPGWPGWWLVASLLAACGGEGPDGPPWDGDGTDRPYGPERPVVLDGPCPAEELHGTFALEHQELFGVFEGSVADGVVPVTVLERVQEEGPCRLLRRNVPFCTPPCGPGFTCDHAGACVPFPESRDLGRVVLRGAGGPRVLTPVQPGSRYFDLDLPNPPFDPGAAILLDALDAPGAPLLLEGWGVPELVVEDMVLVVEDGEPIALRWTPPPGEPLARVRLELTIDQHGASPLRVVCEVDDVGEAEVPAALVEGLFAAGVSGFPNARLGRWTVDSAPVPGGCAELRVGSVRTPDVRVTGHTPCDEPEDCPEELTCDLPTNTCL